MTNKQTSLNAAIAQAVAEAVRVAIQVMTPAEAERSQNVGPTLGGPIRKQLTFDLSSTDK